MAMIVAGFTGGQAEELRRAMGFKRSRKAHGGDRSEAARGHGRATASPARRRTRIVHSITSFALYGFPESHAASFALHRLCQRVSEVPLPGGLHLRHAEQPADGLLLARDPDQRCAAARPARAAGGRDAFGLGLHGRRAAQLCGSGLRYVRGSARGSRPRHRARARRPFTQRGRSGACASPNCAKTSSNRLAEIGALNSLDRHPPPRRALAGAARHPARRPAARAAGRKGRAFAARPHEHRRAPVGRFPRHRPDRRPPSHGLPPRGDERAAGCTRAIDLAQRPQRPRWCASPER